MLDLKRNFEKLYIVLYGLILSLLVVPWAYYEEKAVRYSFLPRRIIFVLIAAVGFLVWFAQERKSRRSILLGIFFSCLGIAHWKINQFLEPHYFWEFFYIEIATLVLFAPASVKEKMLKYSTIVLYIFLAKALYFRMGTYIHGGLLSSNLYGTYIVYLSFLEVARRRYWNLIPAFAIIFYVGSKACYLASIVLLLFAAYRFLESHKPNLRFVRIVKNRINGKFNFYWALGISALSVFLFTLGMVQTDYYKDWSKSMEGSKAETTQNNMIMYGLNNETPAAEEERKVLLLTKEMQFNDNKISITAPPLITNVGMSVGLRLTQYSYIYENIGSYFFLGNTTESQSQMFGHNPHSAVPDIISRLGLLYLVVVLIFYANFFKSLNLFFFNLGILPVLCFQPYGFTIGHSIVLLSLIYALAKHALGQSESNKG